MTALLAKVRRLVTGRPTLDHLTFTVFTRKDCCCCHTAIALLTESQRRHGFRVELVDVDSDPALAEAHGLSVPVVALNGKIRFRGVVNPALLDRLLKAESERPEAADGLETA